MRLGKQVEVESVAFVFEQFVVDRVSDKRDRFAC